MVSTKMYMYASVTKAEIYDLLRSTYGVPAYYELISFETDPFDSTYFQVIFKDTR